MGLNIPFLFPCIFITTVTTSSRVTVVHNYNQKHSLENCRWIDLLFILQAYTCTRPRETLPSYFYESQLAIQKSHILLVFHFNALSSTIVPNWAQEWLFHKSQFLGEVTKVMPLMITLMITSFTYCTATHHTIILLSWTRRKNPACFASTREQFHYKMHPNSIFVVCREISLTLWRQPLCQLQQNQHKHSKNESGHDLMSVTHTVRPSLSSWIAVMGCHDSPLTSSVSQ